MKHYHALPPGWAYPADVYANSLDEAKEKIRGMLQVQRLPNGTDVWEFTPQSQKIVRESVQKMAADYHRAGQIMDF